MMTNDPMDPRKKALVDAMGGGGLQAPAGTPPPIEGPPPAAAPAPAMPKSPFESQNTSVRGYLQEAMKAFEPTVRGIADEAGRKSATQSYLQSLSPEVQKRGGSMSDIRNEKARVDGRMYDFLEDIEGKAGAQMMDITDERPAGGAPQGLGMPSFGGSTINPLLQGNAQEGIQSALSGLTQRSPQLDELLKQLTGGAQ
jgi:hypothetical protein